MRIFYGENKNLGQHKQSSEFHLHVNKLITNDNKLLNKESLVETTAATAAAAASCRDGEAP